MRKSHNQLKIGTVLSYLQMIFNAVIGVVYMPFMIRYLGDSEYGLYNTISSIISALSLLSFGFIGGYVKYYTIYKSREDEESIYKLNGLFLIVFTVIGFIAFICGIVISFNLKWFFDSGLTDTEYAIAKVLMLLLTVNLTISFPMSVFTGIISSNEKFIFLKLVGMLKTVIAPLISLPLLLFGYKSIAIVIVTVFVSFISDLMYMLYVFIVLKQKFIFHSFEKGLFRSLFIYTSFIAINLIVDQINLNIDKLLLARFKGTVEVAIYSVAYNIQAYYTMFSTAIVSVFVPRIHNICNNINLQEKKNKELTRLFIKVGRIQFALLILVLSGFVFWGKPFIGYWAGIGYEKAYYIALLLMIPLTVPLIQNLGIDIQRAENKHQFRSLVYLGMAILNVILTVFMCQKYGAIGAAVGTAISLILANGLIMNIYYHKKLGINIIAFWKNIARMSLGLIVPIIVGVVLMLFVEITSIWRLLAVIVLYTIVYCGSMWFFGLNDYEKGLFLKPIKKVFKRV